MKYAFGVLAAAAVMWPVSEAHSWKAPNAGVKTKSGHPEVVFTFDDGPHKRTLKLLDTLKKHDVQAVFYTVGNRVWGTGKNSAKRKKILDRIIREGHLIGNHTSTHAHLCKVSAAKAESEIDKSQKLYEDLVKMPVFLFRAPYGDYCKRLENMLKKRGLRHDHWDIDPREWLTGSASKTSSYVISKLRRLDGRAVVLMHDTKVATVKAMPKILDWIKAENERRVKKGKKTIIVLGASEWVAQNWDVSLWHFAQGAGAAAGSRLYQTVDQLIPGGRPAGAKRAAMLP